MQEKKPYYNPEIWGGIECTINRIGDIFNDQLLHSKHYDRDTDIDAIADLGIKKIRYPILWEKHQPTPNTDINWEWIEKQLSGLKEKGIDVIAGLVHHGSGPAFTNLLDKNFPYLLASYAKKVAQKFPHIQYYTPVNEPLTTARFSGLYGFWYPHAADDKSFLEMLMNETKGTILAMKAIREVNPDAKLVQTEDLGKTYSTNKLKYQADFENERRWLSYDLLTGRVTSNHALWQYLMKSGVKEEQLKYFQENAIEPDVFGFNYYLTSERYLDERIHLYPDVTPGGNNYSQYVDIEVVRVELKEKSGLEVLLKEAWHKYKKPLALTEVHLHCHREEQLRWFKYVWNTCKKSKQNGIDIQAVTSWAMLGSVGWDKLLTEQGGTYEPGVFDLRGGTLRPTASAKFIKELNHEKTILHTLSTNDGWWLRNSRLSYTNNCMINPSLCNVDDNPPVLIIGKNGTLGKAFAKICEERFINIKLLSRQDCDMCRLQSIEAAIEKYKPWAIINAAGFVRVDDAEKEIEKCFQDNTQGPENLAIASHKYGVKLVSFSSDLVFDGKKNTAYIEDDDTNPLNVYGRSKAESETKILHHNPDALVIRTSAFFGPWDEYNFFHYVRRSLLNEETITVAKDYIISPTYVPHLVHATLDLLIDDEKGIWHLANEGEISWADLAYEVADRYNLNRKFINAVPQSHLNLPAPRPLYSVLTSNRGIHLPSLEKAINCYINEEEMFEQELQKIA